MNITDFSRVMYPNETRTKRALPDGTIEATTKDVVGGCEVVRGVAVYGMPECKLGLKIPDLGSGFDLPGREFPGAKAALDQIDIATFTKRVRLPGSAFVASLFDRLDAWRTAHVERKAQACFERGWL